MRYLVTGGTGFIGNSLVRRLLASGNQVTVLDNGSRNFSDFQDLQEQPKIVLGDIRDYETVLQSTGNIDTVLHLAFINGTKNFYKQPSLIIDVGINGMMNLMEACKENRVSNFILFSSSEVYQQPETIPTPESEPLKIPDILNPRYSYGGAKVACELILANYGPELFNNWKILRPHNVYGPNMGNDHVIPELISKSLDADRILEILGDGSQTRAFCYITDFLDAVEIILDSNSDAKVFHLGTDEEVSIRYLAELILEVTQKNLRLIFLPAPIGETNRRCPDITRITELGFRQKINLRTGLELLIKS